MKDIAMKTILEIQRLLINEGHSPKTAHFANTIAQISSIVTRSAKYYTMHDASLLDSLIFNHLPLKTDANNFHSEMFLDGEELYQNKNNPKRRRLR